MNYSVPWQQQPEGWGGGGGGGQGGKGVVFGAAEDSLKQ